MGLEPVKEKKATTPKVVAKPQYVSWKEKKKKEEKELGEWRKGFKKNVKKEKEEPVYLTEEQLIISTNNICKNWGLPLRGQLSLKALQKQN